LLTSQVFKTTTLMKTNHFS